MSEFALHRYVTSVEPFPTIENITSTEHFEESFNATYPQTGNFLGSNYYHQQENNPFGSSYNIIGNSYSFHWKEHQVPVVDKTRVSCEKSKKRKSTEPSKSYKKNGLEKKSKRRNKSSREHDKQQEVVHVRAKRGQATDTHSLAERVRREKINNKLKCLQSLVPGCQKTMGLVTMLDEIISYVHSLKNQVEFLSLELEAACSNQMSRNKRATKIAQETGSYEAQKRTNG